MTLIIVPEGWDKNMKMLSGNSHHTHGETNALKFGKIYWKYLNIKSTNGSSNVALI